MDNFVRKKSFSSFDRNFSAAEFELCTPCPPPTVPYRAVELDAYGVACIPDGMDDWDFFGCLSPEDFRRRQADYEAYVDGLIAAAEAAQAASLSTLEKHRPTVEYEGVRGHGVVVGRNRKGGRVKLRMEVEEDMRRRYRLMDYIKGVLAPVLPKKSPVLHCCKSPVGSLVHVYHAEEGGMAASRVDRLVHDHNVWVCPVCSLKVAMGRVDQLYQLGERAQADGYACYFLTVTMAHQAWEHLSAMLKDMRLASRYFWESGTVKRVYKSNFIGRVTSTEIMRGFGLESEGNNGWHPHYHIMLIGRNDVDLQELNKSLCKAWIHALNRVGRDGKEGVALKIEACRSRQDVYDYLLKYVFEVTLGNVSKKGRGQHMSFFQMCQWGAEVPTWRGEIEPLIREYYWGTKGRRQLVFSDGLLRRFGVGDKTDDELSEEDDAKILRLLAVVVSREWRRLRHDEIAELRILASRDDRQGVWDYLQDRQVTPYASDDDVMGFFVDAPPD